MATSKHNELGGLLGFTIYGSILKQRVLEPPDSSILTHYRLIRIEFSSGGHISLWLCGGFRPYLERPRTRVIGTSAPPPPTPNYGVRSSTSLMWRGRGAHDAKGRATCGAWGLPRLQRLRVLAARVFCFFSFAGLWVAGACLGSG
ncbi:hypothetical protein CXB51_019598 [Gossypium anomalum]|uniref:Uncharacterized protein n=1 Tax=Gossypium anomalum TaxID=47600 RepID=A0A8J5YAE7_9ROSI|nr:hypothetical protein CXB51_019598 [Gossypium anomalum]